MPVEFIWKMSAIVLIAVTLLTGLFIEMRKPKKDPNDNPDTKMMNDILKD